MQGPILFVVNAAMNRVLVLDRDLARRSQLRSRLTDLQLEVQAVERMDEVRFDPRVDVGLFHVHELLQAEVPAHAVRDTVAYSTEPGDDLFGAAAFDRGAQVFLPSDQFGTVEKVVAARLRSLARTRRLGERRVIALLENRSLRGAAKAGAQAGQNAPIRDRAAGVLLVDEGLRVAHLGGGAAVLFGRDVLGQRLNEVFPGSDVDLQVSSTTQATREGLRVDLPAGLSGVPGRSLAITVHPLEGGSGWLLFLRDVAAGVGTQPATVAWSVPCPAPEEAALLDAASDVFRLDTTRYLDTPTGAVRRAFPELVESDDPVLVRGESGTGRAHVARALHYQRDRSRALVEVPCLGRSPSALESDLFGDPGASGSRDGGLVRLASGGTLLVHDIDRLPRHCQERLAATLATDDAPRLIATTTRASSTFASPRFEPELGRCLEANVLGLSALRDRLDVLESLVDAVVRSTDASGVSPEALEALARHDWPGNLVELADVVSRAARSAGAARIGLDDLPGDWVAAAQESHAHDFVGDDHGPCPIWVVTEDDPVSFEVYERKVILRALAQCEGDRLAAAQLLGIGKSTIYRKIGELGIDDATCANG